MLTIYYAKKVYLTAESILKQVTRISILAQWIQPNFSSRQEGSDNGKTLGFKSIKIRFGAIGEIYAVRSSGRKGVY